MYDQCMICVCVKTDQKQAYLTWKPERKSLCQQRLGRSSLEVFSHKSMTGIASQSMPTCSAHKAFLSFTDQREGRAKRRERLLKRKKEHDMKRSSLTASCLTSPCRTAGLLRVLIV